MNWQDKCEVLYRFRNDARVLIVTKPEYRFERLPRSYLG